MGLALRAAVGTLALVAVLPVAAASGATTKKLETVNVPALAEAVVTKTSLKKGKVYRLVATGTVETRYTSPEGRTTSGRDDALYCFEESGGSSAPGTRCQDKPRPLSALRFKQRGARQPFFTFEGNWPRRPGVDPVLPYDPSHRYEIKFKAPTSGKLSFEHATTLDEGSGAFTVELFGPGARKKKRRPAQCDAEDARAAATDCIWAVPFIITDVGPPDSSEGDLLTSSVDGVGKVFFNRKPNPDVPSTGDAAGRIRHYETYDPSDPEHPDARLIMKPTTGTYAVIDGFRTLRLAGIAGGNLKGERTRLDLPWTATLINFPEFLELQVFRPDEEGGLTLAHLRRYSSNPEVKVGKPRLVERPPAS
jgi:hypothetical protein